MARSTHHQVYQTFLAVMRDLRLASGLTQVMLAKKLGNTQTFVSKMERGERRIDVVEFVEICEALGVDPRVAFEDFLARRRNGPGSLRKLAKRKRKA